jgi:hypothetical protein
MTILKANNISYYRFVKEMGFKPDKMAAWMSKLRGNVTVNKKERQLAEDTLYRLTKNKNTDIILLEPDKYRFI